MKKEIPIWSWKWEHPEGLVPFGSVHPSANWQLCSISALDPESLAWARHDCFCDCAGKAKQKLKGFVCDASAVLHWVGFFSCFGGFFCNGF